MSMAQDVDTRRQGTQQLDDQIAADQQLGFGSLAQIPHGCAPETVPADPPPRSTRLIGIDLARAVAIVGMISVHLLDMVDANGQVSLAFVLSAGKSAALFAVLAGVGIALSTGRDRRPTGRRWMASMAEVAVRALLIGLLGLVLGYLVPADRANVILVSYAALFLLAIPLLRLPSAVLSVLAVVIAVGVPVLSHWWREALPMAPEVNLTFTSFVQQPLTSLEMVLLTGSFPALAWLAYICAGLAVGRAALSERGLMMRLAIIGAALAVVANAASWFVMEGLGGRERLAAVASQTMALEDFQDLLVWGGSGVLPATSPWWLGVMAPHTGTPVDLLFTMGIAVSVIGVALILGLVAPAALRSVAKFGSMPLSLYTAHLILLVTPFVPQEGWSALIVHLTVLIVFALVWRAFFKRGPLEAILGWAAHKVGRQVLGTSPRHAWER